MTIYAQEATLGRERLEHCLIETNHRMKNSLQMIAAMLDIQTDEDARTLSAEGVARLHDYLRTMGALHDLLTQNARERKDPDRLSARDLLDRLVPLMRNLAAGRSIRYQARDVITTPRRGMALAVIAQELISNALKHGRGGVQVTLNRMGETALLEVCSDGPGFPPDFTTRKASRTGLELIEQLTRWDLRGVIRYENRPMTGACVVIEFPTDIEN